MLPYTKQADRAIRQAKEVAKRCHHNYVGTEHLLIGLRREYTGVAGQVLSECGAEESRIMDIISRLIAPDITVDPDDRDGFSPRLQAVLDDAAHYAQAYQSRTVGTEHLLLAIVRDTDCVAARILITLHISLQLIYNKITQVLGADLDDLLASSGRQGQQGPQESLLEQFGTDLTRRAFEGRLDPVIGRHDEIGRLIQILGRKTKNNPCLIGEPGVGKSAIVEGLALQIASGRVPPYMRDKRLFSLDIAGIVAGSKYRGEFEERMKNLIEEVQAEGNILLFLDEVHTMIGAGGAEGSLDAANILKPALARGDFQLIGATTVTEYRKRIEKDAALERRFQPVLVEEPTEEMCVEILEGLREGYEEFHGVRIDSEALREAVRLSSRYIADRNLPDKAIDVLDEACSRVKLGNYRVQDAVTEEEKGIFILRALREEAIKAGDMEEASRLHREYKNEQKRLEAKEKRKAKKTPSTVREVTAEAVAAVVSAWTKIPVQKLAEAEGVRLTHLESALHRRVIGQDEAVTAVAKAVRRGRVGLKDPRRPIGSFLFLGPTGVGKTELSKALAEALFQSEEALIRVDMSEYMEKHSVSKIIGSPPGYVGHEDGGQLSEQVRRHPYSVLLFDEIEKAHPDVFNILLQVLDDGRITDSHGRTVDFKNTVIIMTSNAGAKAIIEPKRLGFVTDDSDKKEYEDMKRGVMEEVRRIFKPEFLNRLDEIIVFHSLGGDHLRRIASLMLREVEKRTLEQMEIRLNFRSSVRDLIVKKGTDSKFGARPLRRAVQNEVEDFLADEILSGRIRRGQQVSIGARNGKLVVFPASAGKNAR